MLILSSLSILFLCSCNQTAAINPSKKELGKWEVSDAEFYTKETCDYNVIVTSTMCSGCEYLAEYIASYQNVMVEKNLVLTYTFDVTNNTRLQFIKDDALVVSQKGNVDVYDTYFYVTPSLYKIKNNKLDRVIIDYNEIRSFLSDIN